MRKRNQVLFILAIVILALGLRIIYLVQTRDNPLFYPVNNGLDPSLYHKRAQLVSRGVWLSPDFIYGMPFYTYFLAALYSLFGEDIFIVRLIQMILGSLSCLLIYFIAKQIFNRRVGYIASVIYALYGMFIFYEGMLLGTTLTVLFSCLIILTLLSIQRHNNYKKWFFLGLLVGLGGLNRASILLFIPFILLWFSIGGRYNLRKKVFSQFIFCITVILLIAPVTVRNYLIAGEFIPITAHSGINFYIGNNPDADGSFKPPQSMHIGTDALFADSARWAEKYTGKEMTPAEVSEFWFSRGLHFIKTQPLRYVTLLFRKVALLFNGYEIFDVLDYSFFRKNFSTVLNLPLPNLRIILPLGLLGISLSLRDWKRHLLLYLFMISYAVSILIYFVNARYRLPLVPFLIIFAGYAIDSLWEMLRNKNYKSISFFLGIFILFSLATNVDIMQQDYTSQYNNLGVAYKQMGKYELAIEAYRETLKINPNLTQTHNNLGNIYNVSGQYKKAIAEFKKALELDPDLAEAHSNLGVVYTKTGNINEAISEYKKALRLRPNLVAAHYNLGVIYQKQGKFDLAHRQFNQTIKFAPDHAYARNNLGVVYFKQNLFREAERQWKAALEIDPGLWQAKENLKRLREMKY